MGPHRKMRVEPGAEVTHYFNRLNINSANTDRTVMNFQQLLSRCDNKKFSSKKLSSPLSGTFRQEAKVSTLAQKHLRDVHLRNALKLNKGRLREKSTFNIFQVKES